MSEHEDTHVDVVEKYTLDGVNTLTLIKHMKGIRMNAAITIIIM